jgi:flavorubredoxin
MAKVLILYYSSYSHTETMANAIAPGRAERANRAKVMRLRIFNWRGLTVACVGKAAIIIRAVITQFERRFAAFADGA